MNKQAISKANLWKEIEARHSSDFIKELQKIPGVRVLVFGGMLRDLMLGYTWKDVDLRILYNKPWREMVKTVGDAIKKNTRVVQIIPFENNFIVYRVLVPGKKKEVIDISVARNIRKATSDLRAMSLFVDLRDGKIIEQRKGAMNDFRNKIIQTCNKAERQIIYGLRIVFRAIKMASQTGFKIHDDIFLAIKNNTRIPRRIYKDIQATADYIEQNGKDAWSELMLGDLFGGLKHDAYTYFDLYHRTGVLDQFIAFSGGKRRKHKNIFNKSKDTFENNLSKFLSYIANTTSHPKKTFSKLKKQFALDIKKSEAGFKTIGSKIRYLQNV